MFRFRVSIYSFTCNCDWKHVLDNTEYLAAIIMDLSKDFDFLPHDLLLLKLNIYGLSKSFLDLLYSYLTNRKQCVKLNQNLSNMLPIFKGSILGLILFNIFINDLFFSVKKTCSMYNYADKSLEKVISALEEDSNSLINWFSANKMQANNEKFQAISVGRKTHDNNVMFNLNSIIYLVKMK